ncbi:MBL fold metallo-hydrolase [Shimazuella alba]|uniref:MBL fold metallo-hydrolase n=1 Tax=Shimazuella alba TaxID=2690964 RepID=A0A6I4VXY5_9BACL|nr:MBL fold metallo-hydrolase [Shimazuella alba]MXQ54736.1 MBL fold metallo-hydrolase [Shimazuella alba]
MSKKRRLSTNVAGDFYVNSACIGCGVCRQLTPDVFSMVDGLFAVTQQPKEEWEKRNVFHALLSCPTAAINSADKNGLTEVMHDFPLLIEKDVYYCGFTSGKSYGGHSYFIKHPEGNWLIDASRFVPLLAKRLEELGGVDIIFLTHNDDQEFLDADLYAKRFGAKRIIHMKDKVPELDAEHLVEEIHSMNWSEDFRIVVVPGHTEGHMVLLYKKKYLFSGDHLYWDSMKNSLSAPEGFYCFYSWSEQMNSMKSLMKESFEWVLPRHGERIQLAPKVRKEAMKRLIRHMEDTI